MRELKADIQRRHRALLASREGCGDERRREGRAERETPSKPSGRRLQNLQGDAFKACWPAARGAATSGGGWGGREGRNAGELGWADIRMDRWVGRQAGRQADVCVCVCVCVCGRQAGGQGGTTRRGRGGNGGWTDRQAGRRAGSLIEAEFFDCFEAGRAGSLTERGWMIERGWTDGGARRGEAVSTFTL